jgi:hypothetical protein
MRTSGRLRSAERKSSSCSRLALGGRRCCRCRCCWRCLCCCCRCNRRRRRRHRCVCAVAPLAGFIERFMSISSEICRQPPPPPPPLLENICKLLLCPPLHPVPHHSLLLPLATCTKLSRFHRCQICSVCQTRVKTWRRRRRRRRLLVCVRARSLRHVICESDFQTAVFHSLAHSHTGTQTHTHTHSRLPFEAGHSGHPSLLCRAASFSDSSRRIVAAPTQVSFHSACVFNIVNRATETSTTTATACDSFLSYWYRTQSRKHEDQPTYAYRHTHTHIDNHSYGR